MAAGQPKGLGPLRTQGATPLGDGEGMHKAVVRRTVDFCSPYVRYLLQRCAVRSIRGAPMMQPNMAGALELLPPVAYPLVPATSFNTKFVHMSTNKKKSPINVVTWTPEGRRCMSGTQSGEFTLWNGYTFNFESIIQFHQKAVRCIQFSHNDEWVLSCDEEGAVKFFKPNLEFFHEIRAHSENCRCITFCPTDLKFASSSDDSTIKVWDFATAERQKEERIMTGHGGDVRWVEWHPTQSLLASASRDTLVKLWDPRQGGCVATMHGHKGMVMQVHWNQNGNWLLSASRDSTLKVYDIRVLKEYQVLQGHTRDVTCCSWHPFHEELIASGGHDGSLIYWLASRPEPQAEVPAAHDHPIWSMSWHPVGHLLATGSGDTAVKFWCRARPGDVWRDRHQREQEEAATAEADTTAAAPVTSTAEAMAPKSFIPGIGEVREEAVGLPEPRAPMPDLFDHRPPPPRGPPPRGPPPGRPPPRSPPPRGPGMGGPPPGRPPPPHMVPPPRPPPGGPRPPPGAPSGKRPRENSGWDQPPSKRKDDGPMPPMPRPHLGDGMMNPMLQGMMDMPLGPLALGPFPPDPMFPMGPVGMPPLGMMPPDMMGGGFMGPPPGPGRGPRPPPGRPRPPPGPPPPYPPGGRGRGGPPPDRHY